MQPSDKGAGCYAVFSDPCHSIDHIFYYGKYEMIPDTVRYELVTDDRARLASDHYPVYVDLILRD